MGNSIKAWVWTGTACLLIAACTSAEGGGRPDGGPVDAAADGGWDAPSERSDGAFDGGQDAGQDAGSQDAADTSADADDTGAAPVRMVFDFSSGPQGWNGGFADYPAGSEGFYELQSGVAALPAPLDGTNDAFMISGNNHSDDLWMYITRRITGLVPGRSYTVEFAWSFATRAPSNCLGVGGAPGESVYMKVGASPSLAESSTGGGTVVFSLDKGNQSTAGADSSSAGNVASGLECPDDTWTLLERSVVYERPVLADPAGELSVFIGTDSGFEATTELYYDDIALTLVPSATSP